MKTAISCWLVLCVALTVNAHAQILPPHQSSNPWYQDARQALAQKPNLQANSKAKNVILFIGDGMGVSTITAARILEGQNKGHAGEENQLSFEAFPFTGLSKTYNVNAQTPDSAGTMTAIISGVKTDAGVIGIDENVRRGNCQTVAGHELVTTLDLAELAGMATGFVTTTRVTHATPAALYAKSPERNWEDNSDLPETAIAAGCSDIAAQLIDYERRLKKHYPKAKHIDGIEVVMGGGRRHFLPSLPEFNSPDAASDIEGDRNDERHLINEWQQRYPDGAYVYDKAGFDLIEPSSAQQVLALFNESHMHYEADRHNDQAGEPSLSEMTTKALAILKQREEGFFLMVEAGRIDHAHHAGNAFNALNDTIELSNAVKQAIAHTDPAETLIVVTADHSHVFTMAGYPKRGNPILGKVVNVGEVGPAKAADGKPYTTLAYANGLGFRHHHDETDADTAYAEPAKSGRTNLTDIDTEQAGYHQEALVPLSAETHGGEDVAVYATGPGAEGVLGVNEQNLIFHVINQAAQLERRAIATMQ